MLRISSEVVAWKSVVTPLAFPLHVIYLTKGYLTWLEAVSRCENQTSREIPIPACAVGVNSREIFSPFLRVQNRLVSSRKVIRICSFVVIALKWNPSKWSWLVEMLLVCSVECDSHLIFILETGRRQALCEARSVSIFPNEWRSVSQMMCCLTPLQTLRRLVLRLGCDWGRFTFAWIVVILHKNYFILLRAKRLSSWRSSDLCIPRRHCQRVVGLYELTGSNRNI